MTSSEPTIDQNGSTGARDRARFRPVPVMQGLGCVAAASFLALACSGKSPTGSPGPLGPAWDGQAAYEAFQPEGVMPAEYARNLAAIRAALPFKQEARVAASRVATIEDDGKVAAKVELTWSTVRVGDKHVFAAIAAAVVSYGSGYTCQSKGAVLPKPGLGVHLYPQISLTVDCVYATKTGSSSRSATAIFGDGDGGPGVYLRGWSPADNDEFPADRIAAEPPTTHKAVDLTECGDGANGSFQVTSALFRPVSVDEEEQGDCNQSIIELNLTLMVEGKPTCKATGVGISPKSPEGSTHATYEQEAAQLVGQTLDSRISIGQCWTELSLAK